MNIAGLLCLFQKWVFQFFCRYAYSFNNKIVLYSGTSLNKDLTSNANI